MNSETRDVEQLTSYERNLESMSTFYDNVEIWEAARATSAATSFFDPISIGRGELRQQFVDGATGANNPVRRLWHEAQRQWDGPLEPRIQCLVSIGTGVSLMRSFGDGPVSVMRTLKAIATETERTAAEFYAEHDDLCQRDAYIRLNVMNGLENVGLDEVAKKDRILAATRRYGELPEIRNALKRFRAVVTPFRMESVQADLLRMNFVNNASRRSSGEPIQQPQDQVKQRSAGTKPRDGFSLSSSESNPIFFKQPAEHYWDHLTLDSLREYEALYEEICDGRDGLVSCKTDIDPNSVRWRNG